MGHGELLQVGGQLMCRTCGWTAEEASHAAEAGPKTGTLAKGCGSEKRTAVFEGHPQGGALTLPQKKENIAPQEHLSVLKKRIALIGAAARGKLAAAKLRVQGTSDVCLGKCKGVLASVRGRAEEKARKKTTNPIEHAPESSAEKDAVEQKADAKKVKLLEGHMRRIRAGGNVNEKDDGEKTALMLAAETNSYKDVKWLIQKGAGLDEVDGDGYSALMIAAENNHPQVARLLIDGGARVNLRSTYKWTALMVAAMKGHEEMVQMLLEKGAEVTACENHGWTALFFAEDFKHMKVEALLRRHGAER